MHVSLYYGRPLNRFPGLFGDQPEKTIVSDRLFNAIAASTRFAGVPGLLRECQHDHYLLQVIQCEVLRDAAKLAFTKQVDALRADLEKRRIPELQTAYQARLEELKPLLARWRGLDETCRAAVNGTYSAEAAQWRKDSNERDRIVADLELKLAIATAFAAESGLPLTEADAQIPGRIAEAKADCERKRSAQSAERDRVVRELKQKCEEDKRPLRAEYDREQAAAKQALDEAVRQAQEELRQKVDALREKFEQALNDAEAQVNAQYGPLNEVEKQMQTAVAAFAAQMKAVRGESARAVSAGISTLFAIQAIEEQPTTVVEPAAKAAVVSATRTD